MSIIYFNLDHVQSLGPMVAAPGAPGVNPMPHLSAIYVVYNHNNDNAYVGIAGDLHARCAPRAQTVSDLGLDNPYVDDIEIWYGDVWVYNTPGVVAPPIGPALPPGPGGAPPPTPFPPGGLALHGAAGVPGALVGGFFGVYSNIVTTTIDGVMPVNLERVLIRAYLNAPGIAGPAVSTTNTAMAMLPVTNTSANPVHIYVNCCGSPNALPQHFGGALMPGAAM